MPDFFAFGGVLGKGEIWRGDKVNRAALEVLVWGRHYRTWHYQLCSTPYFSRSQVSLGIQWSFLVTFLGIS